jgi:hypothetical protein
MVQLSELLASLPRTVKRSAKAACAQPSSLKKASECGTTTALSISLSLLLAAAAAAAAASWDNALAKASWGCAAKYVAVGRRRAVAHAPKDCSRLRCRGLMSGPAPCDGSISFGMSRRVTETR